MRVAKEGGKLAFNSACSVADDAQTEVAALKQYIAELEPSVERPELPALDVTEEDILSANQRYDWRVSDEPCNHARHEYAALKCRERQLLAALSRISQVEKAATDFAEQFASPPEDKVTEP